MPKPKASECGPAWSVVDLPMEGLNAYRNTIAPLLFGADHPVLAQNVAPSRCCDRARESGADFLKILPGFRRVGQ
ncbi:MAG: hypothetical protein ACLR9P_05900 [Escherichia coli]